jgi:hypothetical protein
MYKEIEFMLSEFEILKRYPKGKRFEKDGELLESTGEVLEPIKSYQWASFPRLVCKIVKE